MHEAARLCQRVCGKDCPSRAEWVWPLVEHARSRLGAQLRPLAAPRGLHDCGLAVSFEIRTRESSSFVLLFKGVESTWTLELARQPQGGLLGSTGIARTLQVASGAGRRDVAWSPSVGAALVTRVGTSLVPLSFHSCLRPPLAAGLFPVSAWSFRVVVALVQVTPSAAAAQGPEGEADGSSLLASVSVFRASGSAQPRQRFAGFVSKGPTCGFAASAAPFLSLCFGRV